MSLITQDNALEILQPHLTKLCSILTGAWSDYLKYSPEQKILHSPRTRANIIYDHAIDRAKTDLVDDESVRLVELPAEHKQKLLLFRDALTVRPKMLDGKLMPKNHKSAQNSDLMGQRQLPGIPDICHLIAGYQLNGQETAVESLYLTCPNGKKNYWAFDISNAIALPDTLSIPYAEDGYGSEFEQKKTEHEEKVVNYEGKAKS